MPNFESGYRSILAAKLAPADSTMTVATPPTVTSGRLYLNNGAQEERIKFTGVSGSTITGLVRGLSKTADPATAGTGLSWIAGTEVKLVDMHDQLWDESKTETITGAKTFTNAIFSGISNLISGLLTIVGANAGLVMTGAKKGFSAPSLTTTERLALTPVNGMMVYDSTIGLFYQYKGGSWASVDTGTATPVASETTAGTVEQATAAEQGAGTETGATGAPLFVNPKNLVKTSNGAGDENKVPVLNASGKLADGFISITTDAITFTRDMSASSGDVTYSHLLGKLPKQMIFLGIHPTSESMGAWLTPSVNKCSYVTASGSSGTDDTKCIYCKTSDGNINTGVIASVSTTQFTITWAKTGGPAAQNMNFTVILS